MRVKIVWSLLGMEKQFLSDYIESILFLFIIMTSGDLSTEISTFFVGEEQILFKI